MRRSIEGAGLLVLVALLASCTAGSGVARTSSPTPTTSAVASVTAPASTSPTPSASPVPVSAAAPCSGAPSPGAYDHVVWIVMENKPAGAALGSSTSTTRTLAHACGYASDYHATTHPSLPNYLALTSGSTHGVTDDGSPAQHPIAGPSIFSEVAASGRQWATYAEAMPGSCVRTSSGTYATKHNPALYYTGLGGSCSSQDVPLGSPATGRLATALHDGSLPAFVLVVPDLCDDTHDCPVSLGDRWLRRWVDAITSSPTYAAGRTAVFVTWDEDDRSHGNVVALLVLAPAVRPGTVVASPTSHLTLLRTAEDLLGLSGSLVPVQPSMRAAFGL